MDERRIDLGPVGLALVEAGAGGEPWVVVHGFQGAKEDFTAHADWLAALGVHVAIPDLRGHGDSDHPPGERHYSLSTFAADVVGLADALGWGRFGIVGTSMGGIVAQLVALEVPGRITGLVLQDTWPAPLAHLDPAAVAAARDLVRGGGFERLADLTAAGRGAGADGTHAFRRLLATRPGWAEFEDRKFRATAPDLYAAIVGEFVDCEDRTAALEEVEAPSLVVVGEQDRSALGPCRRLARALPRARLVVIRGAGHHPQHEAPERWRAEVGRFLAGRSRPGEHPVSGLC